LTSERGLAELESTQGFSPSALESYVTCPFMWFVERVVGIDELEKVIDKQYVGQLMHKVLSDTYLELRAAGLLPLTVQHLPLAASAAATIAEALVDSEDCPGTPPERRLAECRLKRMAANLFAMEVAAGGARSVVDTELTVGGVDGVDVGGVAIRGRIDRVDSTPGGELFVVDYKSGSLPDKGKIGTAEGLQLPLYLLALAAERPAQRVVGGEYISPQKMARTGVVAAGCEGALGTDARGCRSMEHDELQGMLEQALELACAAADGIRSGNIAPRSDRSCPDWCRLGPVCRTRRGGRRRRV
jgi:ATP-dependent helicase/nuclease subunit B